MPCTVPRPFPRGPRGGGTGGGREREHLSQDRTHLQGSHLGGGLGRLLRGDRRSGSAGRSPWAVGLLRLEMGWSPTAASPLAGPWPVVPVPQGRGGMGWCPVITGSLLPPLEGSTPHGASTDRVSATPMCPKWQGQGDARVCGHAPQDAHRPGLCRRGPPPGAQGVLGMKGTACSSCPLSSEAPEPRGIQARTTGPWRDTEGSGGDQTGWRLRACGSQRLGLSTAQWSLRMGLACRGRAREQ